MKNFKIIRKIGEETETISGPGILEINPTKFFVTVEYEDKTQENILISKEDYMKKLSEKILKNYERYFLENFPGELETVILERILKISENLKKK